MVENIIADSEYNDFIQRKLKIAQAIEDSLPILKKEYDALRVKGKLGQATWDYIYGLRDFKYLNVNPDSENYYLDWKKLDKVFENITNDKRVFFFNKLFMIIYIDLFYDLRIEFSILNKGSIGKKNNRIFKKTKDAIGYQNDSSSPIMEDGTKKKQKETVLLNESMNRGIKKVNDGFGWEVTKMDISGMLNKILTGTKRNEREIELSIFPLFLGCILLDKENEDGMIGKHNTTKMFVLQDIFPIILPIRYFPHESNYAGEKSHLYNKKKDFLESLINGK